RLWTRRKPLIIRPQTEASVEAVTQVLAQAEQTIAQLETEALSATAHPLQLRAKVAQVTANLGREELRVGVAGGSTVGKTSLIQTLESTWVAQLQRGCALIELPIPVGAAEPMEAVAPEGVPGSDLVLFVIQADITQPEYQSLSACLKSKRTLLVFNKQDQYLPTQRPVVLKQLQEHLQELITAPDILAIATRPHPVKVRQHQADGTTREWVDTPQPQIETLAERLNQLVVQEAAQLILQTTFQEALALQAEARGALNQVRRERALPLIEQFQWIAGATAFANPFPSLDLLAGAAISSQMVLDLSALYQQKFSWAQAQAVASTLAGLMLKLGLVEFSTQTLGSMLKQSSLTYVAGGVIQGGSAAYLTRLAGLSLIEHFQALSEQPPTASNAALNLDKLSHTLQTVFRQNQRIAFFKSLVTQLLEHLPARISSPFIADASLDPEKLEENRSIASISAASLELPVTST
ncbi:MAG TPA: DUF697 domain-containing protein, partial [Candidatus Caenarcaniphilales bacterium]